MTKEQAIHNFWSSFGWRAIDEQSAYDDRMDIQYPFISYSVSVASLDEPVSVSADLWDRSTSWKDVTDKAEEIAKYVRDMSPIPLDEGYLFITKGVPFAQRMAEDTGLADVRRIHINLTIEFFTSY
ncbi:MAG: hypothetical protein IJP92_00825 [Lachnospiraceae bacterium]|nr:hypothetical protein [Lachnospiraceae bacterium]